MSMKQFGPSFSAATRGQIPTAAVGAEIRFSGKQIPVGRAADAALIVGAWQDKGVANPVNAIVELSRGAAAKGFVTAVAPGGRPASEIPSELLQGRKAYTAQPDMFGPPVTN